MFGFTFTVSRTLESLRFDAEWKSQGTEGIVEFQVVIIVFMRFSFTCSYWFYVVEPSSSAQFLNRTV